MAILVDPFERNRFDMELIRPLDIKKKRHGQCQNMLSELHNLPKPFVKWAGGKRQLIDILLANTPPSFGTFYEPFVGGGALLFALLPKKAVISDTNAELINAYLVIRDNVESLIKSLRFHKNDESYFYEIRAKDPARLTDIQRASRFIYLNKTCYNGLYRENSKGQFNAPFGRYKNPNIVDSANLRAISAYLNQSQVIILCQDYKYTVETAQKGDFVYFDPPYYPTSQTASFTKYVKSDFTAKDQEELAEIFRILSQRGCFVMLSNSNTSFIRELYRDFNIFEINANRFINCKGDKRGKGLFEVLVKNF